jgi:hypothetical protein
MYMGEMRNSYKSVGKDLKGGDHLVYMWMGDIIEIDLKEIG